MGYGCMMKGPPSRAVPELTAALPSQRSNRELPQKESVEKESIFQILLVRFYDC